MPNQDDRRVSSMLWSMVSKAAERSRRQRQDTNELCLPDDHEDLSLWPANIFWCILGMILHLFECLNDEEFHVFLCSRWALYFSEVVPSWDQSIEMSLSMIHRPLTIHSAAWEGGQAPFLKPWLGPGRIGPPWIRQCNDNKTDRLLHNITLW